MSALRNVGELATPYFLLELWAHREQAEIDPGLKANARKLVRDARGFETRGEEPDDEWRLRRLDLFALAGVSQLQIELGDQGNLGIWRDMNGRDALLVGDLKGFVDADVRQKDADDPLATTFELALDKYEGETDWGLLLAGLEARVYRRSSGIAQQYLAMDLDSLVELDDEPTWRAFVGIFRSPAFSYGDDDTPLIRRIVDESRRHASALANDMRADVVDAAEAIIQGAMDHPSNAEALGDRSRATLHQLFEETLYYLYRILFVLYAEARDVLPISGLTPYATTYSIDHLIERARTEGVDIEGSYFDDSLRRLFAVLWNGPQEATEALGIQAVGGELFDPSRTALMDALAIPDRAWRRALTAIALGKEGSQRRKAGRRASFSELGVDQLGSIYEGLLVLEPYLAPGPRLLVRNGDRRVVEAGMEGGLKVERELVSGDFVLESASGRRKGSGSFYTPVEITEYLVHAALDPLTEPLVDLAATDPQQAETELLGLKVCDPAMGSGAFLVQAARVLALALARIRAAKKDGRATPDAISIAKRLVVRRCLYGVDLNPLAVALAKVSLWLETLEKGRPLTFLDAHLRVGDSLVGVDFAVSSGLLRADELTQWPHTAVDGLKKYLRAEAGEPGIEMLERLKERKKPSTLKQAQIPGTQSWAIEEALAKIAAERVALTEGEETLKLELEAAKAFEELEQAEDSLRNRLRAAGDFWCAQWFSFGEDSITDASGKPVLPATVGDFELIIGKLLSGEPLPGHLQAQVDAAAQVKTRRHFFHWALEFPEAIVDRGGFDAVAGNPPWNTLSPDVKEFFSTYDPAVFKKGVPKSGQERRKHELRKIHDIDHAWRTEARYLHELSAYARPESGQFKWYAPHGQHRKGDANVFRLFVERAFNLLREGGRLAQVLPDSLYISAPATGVRQRLLTEGVLERCYVFENRRHLFPIDSRLKVVLLTAQQGSGPTERFNAAFFVGKDAAGRGRAVSLEELPAVLADLDEESPVLALDQIRALSPETWSFPELQTALDAEIAAHCATRFPPLNLDERGWNLTYLAEIHAHRDSGLLRDQAALKALGAQPNGLEWAEGNGTTWLPVVKGAHLHGLEFPLEGKAIEFWVSRSEFEEAASRKNDDGSLVSDHFRVAWRRIARSVDERSSIAAVLPPNVAIEESALTVRGGTIEPSIALRLAALLSSFCFDYLVRFRGTVNLRYAALSSIPVPPSSALETVQELAANVVCRNRLYEQLWNQLYGGKKTRPDSSAWEIGHMRAVIDARVAVAYELSLEQLTAILCTFPNIDTVQPMLPGEPKSFVTRDLALLAFCQEMSTEPPLTDKLLAKIGIDLPVNPDYRKLEERVARYKEIGAVPYRPTPRGGRVPTDPGLIQDIVDLISDEAKTAGDIAEALEETEKAVKAVLKRLEKDGEVFAEGKGKNRRYYVIEEGS